MTRSPAALHAACLVLASASAACVLAPPADLAISIADPSDAMAVDGTVSYAITVTDTGPAEAADLVVVDHLPDGAQLVTASGPGWSCAAAIPDVMCARPAVGVAEPSSITLVVRPPPAGGALSSTAQVTAITPDTNPSNNTAIASSTVNTAADLSIALRETPAPLVGGSTLHYALDVTNLGPSVASSITVTGALPAGVTATGVTGTGWDCRVADQAIACTRASLAIGAAPTIDLAVEAPGRPALLSTSATVTSTSPDLAPDNNAAAVTACSREVQTSQITVLHVLQDPDGMAVRGALVELDHRLYGLAGERGPNGSLACSSSASWNTIEHIAHCPGALFSLALDGSDFRVDHAFTRLDDLTGRNLDGYHPYGSLRLGPDGKLHGVTQMGGTPIEGRGTGVAFTFDPRTGAFTTDHSFFAVPRAFDGEYPMGAPAVLPTGEVLGTAKGGGTSNTGTVWRASSTAFSYASLTPQIGTSYGGLTLGRDGLLHGTTWDGGAHATGTYFTVDPATLVVTVIDSFAGFTRNAHGTDNTAIQAPTVLSDGTLVMAREFGGTYGTGLVVKLGPAGIVVLKEFADIPLAASPRFSNLTGGMPNGQIAEGIDGMIYGTTAYGGAYGSGSIYRIAPDGSQFELLHSFQGGYPYGGLTLGSDGALYGTTFNTSQVFRFVPPTACR